MVAWCFSVSPKGGIAWGLTGSVWVEAWATVRVGVRRVPRGREGSGATSSTWGRGVITVVGGAPDRTAGVIAIRGWSGACRRTKRSASHPPVSARVIPSPAGRNQRRRREAVSRPTGRTAGTVSGTLRAARSRKTSLRRLTTTRSANGPTSPAGSGFRCRGRQRARERAKRAARRHRRRQAGPCVRTH